MIKSLIFSLLCFLLLLCGFSFIAPYSRYSLPKEEELVNMILANVANSIKGKYKIHPCGAGAAMPEGIINKLTLCFTTNYSLNEKQLRSLLICSSHELLFAVTSNQEIQQNLKNQPFNIRNIQIIIYNQDSNGREVYDPGISTVQILNGILTFSFVDSKETFKYNREFEESYEEALEKIKQYDNV